MVRCLSPGRAFWLVLLGLAGWLSVPRLEAQLDPQVESLTAAEWIDLLRQAYPGRITAGGGDLRDPTLKLDGLEFNWADQRLLPAALAGEKAKWDRQVFFLYNPQPADRALWTDQQMAEIEQRLARREAERPRRHPAFFDQLWNFNKAHFEQTQIVSLKVLGFEVKTHRLLAPAWAAIEKELLQAGQQNPEVAGWLKTLQRIDGYNARNIAGTNSRSSHSYGTAFDLVPRTFGGKIGYWRWALPPKAGPWYRQAWTNRWQVPEAIAQIFYNHGFIWGGNWLLFDPVHFEYRPEQILAWEKFGGRSSPPSPAPLTTESAK